MMFFFILPITATFLNSSNPKFYLEEALNKNFTQNLIQSKKASTILKPSNTNYKKL